SASARHEAALALADFVPTGEAVDLLGKLAFYPDRLGRRARNALVNKAEVALIKGDFYKIAPILRRIAEYPYLDTGAAAMILDINTWPEVDRDGTEDHFAADLLSEISQLIRMNYPPDLSGSEVEQERELERLQPKSLAIEAAKTFVSMVDPFCAYLDEEDLTDMESMLEGKYGGIGAWVGMRFFNGEPKFTILVPMYNQPAHQAGLKAMDWVEKIDDVEIEELNLKEIISKLKGIPGTKVRLLVHRRGWQEAREVTVERKKISVPSVRARMLPENIGYIRIEHFGDENSTPEELSAKLRELEAQGMRGLVLDLSNNPGGLLLTAVNVADMFLPKNKLVVYSQGKPDSGLLIHERRDYKSRTNPHPDYPMVILINRGSASASEIVAGALRDHKRAVLVGQRTFGKGSVQSLFNLNTPGPDSKLKLTIAKYYLPNGDCIHNKGIEPDIKIEPEIIEAENWKAINKVRDGLQVFDYVRREFPLHEEKFRELLEFDHEDLALYPASDALVKELQEAEIEIDPQDLRREIRKELVSLLESEHGEEIVIDPEAGLALQKALLELRKKLPPTEADAPLYVWSQQKIAEYDEKHKDNGVDEDEEGDSEEELQELHNGTE
ncbi:MAG: S41 family peptidase, partial [Planctomycetes bacterium]|nr:S41 family peptidase [Planctomycetota bacterium]